jgi:hypothetical protein
MTPAPARRRWWPRDGAELAAVTVVAGLVRAAFVAIQGVPRFDPWRHLMLIRNLRAGLGFTLYAGQAYVWYSPLWHELAARAPAWLEPDALAAGFSTLVSPLLYVLVRRTDPGARAPALVAALVWAVSGPMVAFTCHYGEEALAVFALAASLCLAGADRRVASALAAGLSLGIALMLRANLAPTALLALPLLRTPRRALVLALGTALPLALAWHRNHLAIDAAPFVFAWDGLAVQTADFDALSTLFVQQHPAVTEALHALHAQVVPHFEWLAGPSGARPASVAFMASGFAALALARNPWLAASGLLSAGYLVFFDRTLSSHYFRVWLGVFPVFCLAAAELVRRAFARPSRVERAGALVLLAGLVLGGAGWLRPAAEIPLAEVTPPEELLRDDAYCVTSGFYPESLMYRFPEKRFLGLPLRAREFEAFIAVYPECRVVLTKNIGVQGELLDYLLRSGFRVDGASTNAYGVHWSVLKRP